MNKATFLYRLEPTRPEMLVEGPTEDEAAIAARHFAYVKALCEEGSVLLAGRTTAPSPDGFGIVILAVANEATARKIMAGDPGPREGLMRAELFPYRVALANPDGIAEAVQA